MKLEFVRLLQVQRDLYALPRGMERFHAYIQTMTDAESGDLVLPLVAMNPMGKDHVPALLTQYLEVDADGSAERAVARIATAYEEIAGSFKVGLVLADDLKGGWTNRYTSEFSYRFETRPIHRRGWLLGILWTSETADPATAAAQAAMAVHRAAYIERHGYAQTLGQMLAQEGFASARAGVTTPELDEDDLAYTRGVVTPLVGATDRPTLIAGLFGDEAARELGYQPLGLSARAGLALALHDARIKA
jgi:hypothetical protein